MLRRLCVFCGSSPGIQPSYARAADDMGSLLAGRGIDLVYGGGNVGLMGRVADAFVAMPGGYDTWEEFCEVLTWSQLGLQRKACAVLNVSGYYDPLLDMADRAVDQGFLRDAHRELLLADTDPSRLLERLTSYTVPIVDKWIDRAAR